jgi:hypothetical protein
LPQPKPFSGASSEPVEQWYETWLLYMQSTSTKEHDYGRYFPPFVVPSVQQMLKASLPRDEDGQLMYATLGEAPIVTIGSKFGEFRSLLPVVHLCKMYNDVQWKNRLES